MNIPINLALDRDKKDLQEYQLFGSAPNTDFGFSLESRFWVFVRTAFKKAVLTSTLNLCLEHKYETRGHD